jgi:hypothetical protein
MCARRTTSFGLLAALALLAALGPVACKEKAPPVPTVDELAAALRAHGVAYTVAETDALPRVQGSGLRLTGKGLEVEVYRIDNPKQLDIAATAARMASKAGSSSPLQAIVHAPFLLIVRREPVAGQVASALAEALPEQGH